ncbi:MAG: esterase-like activity of phytase family protein, partial [Opitutaceae bacterium]|nr:esterase-like activity of phytase family protein [Cytophagales bacterium]
TLETDCGITSDGVVVLSHDPHIQNSKAIKNNGVAYNLADEVLIKDLTLAQLQSTFNLNKLLGSAFPKQLNDTTLVPVAVSFAKANGLLHPYTIPTLNQLFEFVNFYVTYYTTGDGKTHPDAVKRAKNAARVRFNLETKFNPRTDIDERGTQFISRTAPADSFAVKIAKIIIAKGMTERADIQSFAHQTLLKVQQSFPMIRTVYLFTDGPKLPTNANDGGNLQPQGSNLSPWLGGLYWPYRSTKYSNSFRAQRSGGFEGTALSVDKTKLFPLLELPLAGDNNKTILAHEFDLATKTYTGKSYKYKFGEGTNIGDFCMFNQNNGLIVERDNNQGPTSKVKRIYKVTMNATDTLTKTLVADLLDLQDINNLSSGLTTLANDYGVGTTYKFPYQTIESIIVVDSATLVTINDNNYPFSVGRHVGDIAVTTDDITDDNEMIMIKLDPSNNIGHVIVTGTEEVSDIARFNTAISNYPNPFASTTTLSISLTNTSYVNVTISNMMGETIEILDLGKLNEGFHNIDLKNCSGLKNGVYTIRMKTDDKEFITRAVKTN